MRSFVKVVNKDCQVFLYLTKIFPKVSDAKLLGGIFDSPQIKMLMKDQDLTKIISVPEINA